MVNMVLLHNGQEISLNYVLTHEYSDFNQIETILSTTIPLTTASNSAASLKGCH